MRKIGGSLRVAVFLLVLIAGGIFSSAASADVIIDNTAAGTSFTGNWQNSGATGPYGANSLWSRDGSTYTWRFAVDAPGTYEILMWWTNWPSRSQTVPVDIDHEGTTSRSRVTINQQQDGGRWNSLGQFEYVTGKSYNVTVTSQPDPTSTCADAVWVKRIDADTPPSTTIVIDNRDAATSWTGTWGVSGAPHPQGTDSVWSRDGSTFTWLFTAPLSAQYKLSMWSTEWASRSTSVPVTIEHAAGTSQVVINQLAESGIWKALGTFSFTAGLTYRITITSQPGPSSTCADAVRFELDAAGANLPPVAVDDAVTTSENEQITIQPLSNDHDSDGTLDKGSLAVTRNPQHGTMVSQPDGTCLYTPTAGYIGNDSFGYTVADDDGDVSNEANVAITVAINQPPTVSDDAVTAIMNQTVSIPVLENDFDSDGTLVFATLQLVSPPTHGNAMPGVDGTIAYTPAASYKGDDTFTYRVADNDGAFSIEAHVVVTIASNQPPTAEDDTFQTAANSPALFDILANDTAADGLLDPASLLVVDGPGHGAVEIQPDGKVKYTPVAGFSGEDTFSYTVADFNELVSNPAAVTIRVVENTVVDNRDAQKVTSTGNWGVSGADGFWSTDSVWSRDGATFTWLFQPAQTGSYTVSMWWTKWTSRSTSVPVDIQHSQGTARVIVNQQQNGGQWNPIGQHTFVAGTTYRITVMAQPGPSSTCADAVKFDLVDAGQPVLAASIGQVSPSPAVLGAPVTLRGSGISTTGAITGYSWRSSLDGQLGSQATLVTSQLSHGTHQIFLKVQDDTGAWSAEASTTLEVVEHIYACFIYDYEPDAADKFIDILTSMGATNVGGFYRYVNPGKSQTSYIHIVKDNMQGMIDALTTEGSHVMIKGHANYGSGMTFPTPQELQDQIIEDIHYIDDERILNVSTPWFNVSISGMRTGQAYPFWWPIFQDGTSGIMPYIFGDPRGDPPYNYYISYQIPGDPAWYKAETVSRGAIERFSDSGRPAWFSADGLPPNPANPDHVKYFITNEDDWSPSVDIHGTWSEDYLSATQFKENYLHRAAGNGTNMVDWMFTIEQPGNYSVYAWWPAYSGNSTQVPYIVHHSGGNTVVNVNQVKNGGTWYKLGDYYYDPGDYSITVSDAAAPGRVSADAVRVVAKGNPPAVIQAGFNAINRHGPAPLDVIFGSESTGDVTGIYWNFGDGQSNSTRDYITHTYTTPGIYKVTFRVTGPEGSSTVIKSNYITVNEGPAPLQAEFSASKQSGSFPLTTSFKDLSSGEIISWEWDFGDGSPLNTEQYPTHTYVNPGNYAVSLKVTGSDGTVDTESKTNFVIITIMDSSIDNVDYPKRHYRSKTILFRKDLEVPHEAQRYRRLFYDSCNSGNYYLGTFNRGVVFFTVNNSAGLAFYEYIRAYLEGKNDQEIWEIVQEAEPLWDYYDFNKRPSDQ